MAELPDSDQRRSLVGYITLRPDSDLTPDEVKSYLTARLPRHLVPNRIEVLDEMPTLPNGKVDRTALKHRISSAPRSASLAELARTLPQSEAETLAKICGIYSDILGCEVGPGDDFFALGGHSILAVRMFGRLSNELSIELPLSTLFDDPTPLGILEQATALARSGEISMRADALVTIRKGGTLPPLFIVHGAGGNILRFEKLSRLLQGDRPIFGLQAKGVDGLSDPHDSIVDMTNEYLRAVEVAAPEGIVHLAGYSGGGVVALEMGRVLKKQGRLGMIVMLDTYSPSLVPRQDKSDTDRRQNHVKQLRERGPVYILIWIKNRIRYEILRQKRQRFARLSRSGKPVPHHLRDIVLVSKFDTAVSKHNMRPIDFPVLLIGSEEARTRHPAWSAYAGEDFSIEWVPGTHYTILFDPIVETVADLIDEAIGKAD